MNRYVLDRLARRMVERGSVVGEKADALDIAAILEQHKFVVHVVEVKFEHLPQQREPTTGRTGPMLPLCPLPTMILNNVLASPNSNVAALFL